MRLALIALFAAASLTRPFADERQLLDGRLETLRRILPDGPNPSADAALLRELGQAARLRAFDVRPRPPLEAGGRGEVALDVAGSGHFSEIERFFRSLALAHRLPDVESLTLSGSPDTIQLAAVVRLPYRPLRAPLPLPPDGARGRVAGVPRPQADAFVRDQALALAKAEAIAAWRRVRRNPRLFLAELVAISADRPVVFSHADWRDAAQPGSATPAFVVRGLTVGEGPARALEARFERGFFRVSEFMMARQGACLRFEVKGASPVAGPEAALPLPSDDPFVADEAPCRVDRDAGRTVAVKAGAAGKSAGGTLSMRLRDVDLPDVFSVLHQLTGEGFLVDGDVTGRANLELTRVTIREALDALQKQGGLRIGGPGALHRVAVDRKSALAPAPATGGAPLARFALKRAEVRDVLALMSEADPGLVALGPPGFLGRASLWVRDASLVDLRGLLLASAGLGERVEEGQRILEPAGGASNGDGPVPVAARGDADEPRLVLGAHQLAVREFEVAGVASAGESWLAFAYSPTGTLHAYKPGDRLSDGSIKDVQSTDVLLETDDGALRVLVPPLK
jgi:hypothetical protein